MDILVLESTPGRRNERYALVIVCKFTQRVWVYPFSSKPDAIVKFQQWRDHISKHDLVRSSPRMFLTQQVRSDRESVFTSKTFRDYAAASGIRLQFAYSGEKHASLAERNIGILKSMVKCMLLANPYLDVSFWPDALQYAA